MNSIAMSCGPASPMWATRRDAAANAAAHCSKTAGSHSWPCACEARGPTQVVSHVCRRCLAGRHPWRGVAWRGRGRGVGWCGVGWGGAGRGGVGQGGVGWRGVAWHGMVWCGVACGVWRVAWHDVVLCS